MNNYVMDERLSRIVNTLGRIDTGDLVPWFTKILMHIDRGEGMEMLQDITQCDLLERNNKIALIAIIRVASFDFEMTYGWNMGLPSDLQATIQFWDEATDILDGTATLYVDVVDTKNTVDTGYGYIHKILNCTNNHTYKWVLPHMNWCRPVDNEIQNKQK